MLNLAVKQMISHQSLSVKDAMKLADFSAANINNKNMQRKVLRCLPGMGKCQLKVFVMEGREGVINRGKNTDISQQQSTFESKEAKDRTTDLRTKYDQQ
jgi:hypothetical protein